MSRERESGFTRVNASEMKVFNMTKKMELMPPPTPFPPPKKKRKKIGG